MGPVAVGAMSSGLFSGSGGFDKKMNEVDDTVIFSVGDNFLCSYRQKTCRSKANTCFQLKFSV